MQKLLAVAAFLLGSGASLFAQNGNAVTQVLVGIDAQTNRAPTQSDITLKVNGKPQPLAGWSQVPPGQMQIAILIDNNRPKKSVGDHLDSLQDFAMSLPQGAQLYIGYMSDGAIHTEQGFTADHAYAAARFRRPSGHTEATPGPFTCLSTFVKAWPAKPSHPAARFVLLLTDGVDFRPSFAVSALDDAQRAGVAVFAVYLNDVTPASRWGAQFGASPIDALDLVTVGTGGRAYYELVGEQPSLATYLAKFRAALAGTYVASVAIPAVGTRMPQLKVETKLPGVKLVAPKAVCQETLRYRISSELRCRRTGHTAKKQIPFGNDKR